jgi:hypothetical protein
MSGTVFMSQLFHPGQQEVSNTFCRLGLLWIHRIPGIAEALQFIEERTPADAEGFGGFGPIELMLTQGMNDGLPFFFLQPLA